MAGILLIAFITLPIVEIALLIKIGGSWGVLNTVFLVILTAVIGALLVRQQGLSTLAKLNAQSAAGEVPTKALAEGAMLLVAGAVLLTPGFITDVFGFALLIPAIRGWVFDQIGARILAHSHSRPGAHYTVYTYNGQNPSGRQNQSKINLPLEGEYRDSNGSDEPR